MWSGDSLFLFSSLIEKDFKIRYRNMSLRVLRSLLNPLVTMGVLTFVFTRILKNPNPDFALFVMCGLVPISFFSIACIFWATSLVDNAGLIKRAPREIIPLAAVLAIIPMNFRPIYQLDPVAALAMAMRDILIDGVRPGTALLVKLTGISCFMLASGGVMFRSLKPRFSDHL